MTQKTIRFLTMAALTLLATFAPPALACTLRTEEINTLIGILTQGGDSDAVYWNSNGEAISIRGILEDGVKIAKHIKDDK